MPLAAQGGQYDLPQERSVIWPEEVATPSVVQLYRTCYLARLLAIEPEGSMSASVYKALVAPLFPHRVSYLLIPGHDCSDVGHAMHHVAQSKAVVDWQRVGFSPSSR